MSDESNGTAWRWTAPEGILNQIFTIKSDVWSYGMTLAEMCQYGAKPWSVKPAKFKNAAQIIHWVEGDAGKMHDIQEHWPPVLKMIMTICWEVEPDQRPSFAAIVQTLYLNQPGTRA